MEMIVLMVVVAVIKSMMDSNKAKSNSKAMNRQAEVPPPRVETPEEPKLAEQRAGDFLEDAEDLDLGKLFANFGNKVREVTSTLDESRKWKRESMALAHQTEEASAKANSAQEAQKKRVAQQRALDMERPVHEKLKPTIKPLQNAFDNTTDCDHRMTLNPNIEYQRQSQVVKTRVKINPSKDNVIQGVIWSEILGKPKAHRP